MSTTNLYQVIKEEDLKEILNDHIHELTVIMFSSNKCQPCKTILPTFVQTAQQRSDCFFVYIDVLTYIDKTRKYTEKLKCTPRFSYYYNNQEIAYVIGKDEKLFTNTLNDLIYRIKEKKAEIKRKNLLNTYTTQYTPHTNFPQQQPLYQTQPQTQQVQQTPVQQVQQTPIQQTPVQQQQPVQQQLVQQQPFQQQPVQQQPVQQQLVQQQLVQQQPIQQQPLQQTTQQQTTQQQTTQQQTTQQQTTQQQTDAYMNPEIIKQEEEIKIHKKIIN